MAEIKQFQTETKQLLDLMINSIYTHKEIFLRELISNASDAIDKRHYISLTNSEVKPVNYEILVEADKEARTLTITDNGIGMTYDELTKNLGTIAKSGSKEFIEKMKDNAKADVDIIGQFGVGFYSSFMVAEEVTVYTKSALEDKGYVFVSSGLESYSIDECDTLVGSKIVLKLREDTEDNNYSDYLDEYTIKRLVRKYSDYVRYPIKTWVEKEQEGKDEKDEKEEKELVLETINSMVPLWKKRRSDVSEEELNEFYKNKFTDYQDPLTSLFVNVEGAITYNSLVFIPKKPPFDLNNDKFEKGLQLYTKGVFILEKCSELVPDYLKFVKGIVDTSDLSLNISREMLQEDKVLPKIAKNLEKKIIRDLEKMLKDDKEKYEGFFKDYGVSIKYGVYDKYGEKKDLLKDLIIFETIGTEGTLTLKEYVANMPEDQKEIYFASAKSKAAVNRMPQMDLLKSKGFDVLVLKDDIDEFMLQVLAEYDGKKFKSINQGDLDLADEDTKKNIEKLAKSKKKILKNIKKSLGDDVTEVRFSERLTNSPVCLVSKAGLSFEMEKVLANNPNNFGAKAEKVLEINPNHAVFKAIESVYDKNGDISEYSKLLYQQALLIEGIALENPIEFANSMSNLIIESTKNSKIKERKDIIEEGEIKTTTLDQNDSGEVIDVPEEDVVDTDTDSKTE